MTGEIIYATIFMGCFVLLGGVVMYLSKTIDAGEARFDTSGRQLKCGLCNRPLNVADDPLSRDCGGDCWGCIGIVEAEGGHEPSIDIVNREVAEGFRDSDWSPLPRGER